MFWFDRKNPRALYLDNRRAVFTQKDASSKGGFRRVVIEPDVIADFCALPFPEGVFKHVVFDPPHFVRRGGQNSWLAQTYGTLCESWVVDLHKGFAECFRVLAPGGTLVFKWNEGDIPVQRVLACTTVVPLYGNRCGRSAKTHWLVFLKPLV
jgi:SAM-dependent methyltransferase